MAAWSQVLTCSCYELGHTWEPSCAKVALEIAIHGYKESFKIYAPLYVAAALLRRKGKKHFFSKVIPGILQSTLFLGTNAFTFIGSFCVWRKLVGFYTFFNVFICGIPAGAVSLLIENPTRRLMEFNMVSAAFLPALSACFIAINLERKSRRGLLAVYMANLASETLYRMAVYRGYVTPIKNGEVLLFSLVVAGYMYLFRSKNGLKNAVSAGIRLLVGTSEDGSSDAVDQQIERQVRPEPGEGQPHSGGTVLPDELQKLVTRWQQGPKHQLCKHHHSCLYSSVNRGLRMFGLGFAIQGVIKFLGALRFTFKNPRALLGAIKHRDNFHFGAFLGCFAAIFKSVNCLLRWVRDKDSNVHGLISGFLAGWSMMWYRSSSIALYLASKLVEVLYFKGIESGHLPYFKYADVILYTISTSIIFHAAVFECHNLRPAYWKFLTRLTNGRFGQMNRKLLEIYGTDSSKLFPNFDPKLDPRYSEMARKAL